MAKEESILARLTDPKNLAKQARYDNARGAVVAAYTIASRLGDGKYASIEDFFQVVDTIMARYRKDLDATVKLLEEKTDAVHQAKPAKLPHAP